MSEIELEKIYAAHETIKSLNFEKMEFIEPRGRNVPEGVAYELGEGLALKLKDSNQTHFFISGDGRISTPWLMQAFANAMLDNGINVIYSGYNNTTPMFEVERGKLGISGVNITASHNPWQYNGFKMAIEKAIEDGKTKDKIEAKLEELLKKGGTIQQKNQAKIYYLQSTLRKDYIRTARSKGVDEYTVIHLHAQRNAMIPVMTISGMMIIEMLGGVMITETIFTYPGLGFWTATAAQQLDYGSVISFALLFSSLMVIGNLVVDLSYALIDPRVRLE